MDRARQRLPDLAIKAAVLFPLDPGHHDIECACEVGKRAGRAAAWSMRREADEEGKGQIDHMLLADLTSPSLARVPGHISGEHDVFKRGQDFVDLNSVAMNGTEGLRTPEHVPGERVSTQPVNPLGQFFCALLDISKQHVVVGGAWSLFRGLVTGLRARNGVAKPSHRRLVR